MKDILSVLLQAAKPDEFEWDPAASLSALTSFKTGGPASVVAPLTASAAARLYPALKIAGVPVFVLGGGTNVIARDEGYEGVIFSTAKLRGVAAKGGVLTAESGLPVTTLAVAARKRSLTGAEFLYGIPGTVGGAVFMNAGAYGGETREICVSVRAVSPEGEVRDFSAEECDFSYRHSAFSEHPWLVLSASFALQPGEAKAIREKMDDLMQRRRDKQPLEYPSAGSTFKRCEGRFTAQIIDQLGLKGTRRGGAMVSEKHAGFIINYDHATSRDIFDVIDEVRRVVREKENLDLECEVRVIE